MNVSAAILFSALAVGGDPCAPACCESPGLLAKMRTALCGPSCVPCGTPLFAGFSKCQVSRKCDRPGLLDLVKGKLAARTPACGASATCAPTPMCAQTPCSAAPSCCEDACKKPTLLDRIKALLKFRRACPAPACATPSCSATPDCCPSQPIAAPAAPAAPTAPAPKAMPKPPEAPKPKETPKAKTASLVNGIIVPDLVIGN